jgi:hypothetical protein
MHHAQLVAGLSGSRRVALRSIAACQASHGASVGIGRAVLETTGRERSAIFVGLGAAFVASVEAIRWIRLDLLLDPEPSWQLARLILGLFAVSISATAGILAAAICSIVARSRWGKRAPLPLPVRRSSLLILGGAILIVGVLLRVYGLSTLSPLWVDDLSEIRPAAALQAQLSDLPPWSYPVPFREGRWGGSVGTLYLELFHFCLKTFGTTMTGVRAPSVLGGIFSLLTAALLGRAFLPRGGGVLTALVLAGLRWNLIISQWGWNAIVLAPVMDLAALAMLEARRRSRLLLAGVSGVIAGFGAHLHLAAWIGAAGLGLWAIWPSARARVGKRSARVALFVVGFTVAALPLLRDDPFGHYLSRIDGRTRPQTSATLQSRMWWRVETAHAALTGPWWTPDRFTRHDLPGRFRLEWIVGAALALALLKAVLAPRDELSAFLLTSAVAAFLATMAWGRGGTPNSYRYTYLSTTTALAAASGALWVLPAIPWSRRRGAAYAMLGAFAISGALGAKDALIVWPEHRATFDGFGGWDTLVGQAAARWDAYGNLKIDPSVGGTPIVYENVRRSHLGPYGPLDALPAKRLALSLRIVGPRVRPEGSERVVERIRDDWGREYGQVLASRQARHSPRMKPGKHTSLTRVTSGGRAVK